MQEEKKEEEALFTADSELTDEKKSPFCLCGEKPQAGYYIRQNDEGETGEHKRWRCACTNTECPILMWEGWHNTKGEALSDWAKFIKNEKNKKPKKK
ncbi:MAG: hypothetical protein AAB513_01815 [Patescibacteria group bacterium]